MKDTQEHRGLTAPEGQATHDATVPAPVLELMTSGWSAPREQLPAPAPVASYTAKRRAALSARFPGLTLVVPAGGLKVRSNDTDYPFRASSDFFWLTGATEPDSVLVLGPDAAGTLYVPPRSDRSQPGFFTDRRYGELWVGPRPGVAETEAALGIATRALSELPAALDALAPASTRVLRGIDERVDAAVRGTDRAPQGPAGPADLAAALSELRLIKDDHEVAALQRAVDATIVGFAETVAELPRARAEARGERWLEGTFTRRARLSGNDVGYLSIVGCGSHATTLHWVRNDGAVRDGELLLLDMGVESDDYYTADITRTLPVSGRFSPVQRRVYAAVLEAQEAGIAACRPGAEFLEPHRAAMAVIARHLETWGFLGTAAEESLKPEVGRHRRWTLHSVSHMLGIDVHDCARAREEEYREGTLKPGMVLTVEPGLYFQPDDELVPAELRGIGIRIEDDILVTEDGPRNLSAALPRDPDEVERWMAGLR